MTSTILIAIVILIATMAIGVPVALAFVAAAAYLMAATNTDSLFLISYGYSTINSVVLLTIPMFILAGSLMEHGGIGKSLIGAVEKVVGRVKSGLAWVTCISCAIFGAITGSSAATLSCIGSLIAPRLKENGYPDGIVGALIASAAVLGVLIPPSGIMILYAWGSMSSVLACFLATLLPGILLTSLLSIVTHFMIRKNDNIKVYTREELRIRFAEEKAERKRNHEAGPVAALLMPVIILGSIYSGILTPTESAALSVVYALPVGFFVYKKLTVKVAKRSFVSAAVTTGVIMFMMITVQILGRIFTQVNLPRIILGIFTSISDDPRVIMIMINLFMIILGMLVDDVAAVLLATPLLVPVVTSLGYSPIHFAAILAVNNGMGNITPPTAPLLYLSGRMSRVETKLMLKPTLIYILFAWIPTLIITTYVPDFPLLLPRLFGYAV